MDRLKSLYNLFTIYFWTIALSVFYIFEGYSKTLIVYQNTTSSLPKIFKAIIIVYVLGFLFVKKVNVLLSLLLLLISFLIGQLALYDSFSSNSWITFSKYLFPLLLFLFLRVSRPSKYQIKLVLKGFEILLLLNSLLVIIGFLFSLSIFQTYTMGSRFGYNGLFINSTTGSYVYTIAILYLFYTYGSSFLSSWKCYLIIIASFLVGTKVVYFTLTLYLCYSLYSILKSWSKFLFLTAIFFLVAALCYVSFFKLGLFNNIRNESGLISAIFSYRNELLLNDTLPYIKDNWNFLNYFFGGVNDFKLRSEFGVFDVYFFWGLIGGSYYLFHFYKEFITFKLTFENKIILMYFGSIIFFSGNFFTYATLPIYMVILKLTLEHSKNKSI